MALARQARLLALLPFLTLSACASAFPSFSSGSGVNAYQISIDELQSGGYASAFEAVENLRPQWMRTRSRRPLGSRTDIQVYLDRIALGSVQSLKSVPTETIDRIEWVDAATAKQLWGTGHTNGVIAVWTRR